jgi:hypothetical protein
VANAHYCNGGHKSCAYSEKLLFATATAANSAYIFLRLLLFARCEILCCGWNACTFEWGFARIPPQSDGNNIKKWIACVGTANGQKQRHFPKSKLARIWMKKAKWEMGAGKK